MIIVFFIIVCTSSTLFVNGIHDIDNAGTGGSCAEAACGQMGQRTFRDCLLNASLFAASILPLSTSYVICEALDLNRASTTNLARQKFSMPYTPR